VVALLLLCVWSLFPFGRINGFTGDYLPEISWRWSASHEQLLSDLKSVPAAPGSLDPQNAEAVGVLTSAADWPGFRGPRRDSQVAGYPSQLEWQASPPREIWRIPVGPGWSSFACVAGRLFTQEQRGSKEIVSCYNARTGALIWYHADATRFSDVVSGAGPRATPTYDEGRVYTFGARALLNALDASTGRLFWQRDLMAEVNAELPAWGFASSPLVINGVVTVYAGGDGDHGLVAYDKMNGEPRWQLRSRGMNFSSPQQVDFHGKAMVLFGDNAGWRAVEPATGAVLWEFTPADWQGPAIVQPQQISADSLIVPLGDGIGISRMRVTEEDGVWRVEEIWTTNKVKPSFNDFVFHDGHLYGFDQSIFACVDAETGQRNWKGGRYGFGQVLLLSASSQLLVTCETGELVLLAADPSRHRELGRCSVLSGKTWNHPAVAHGCLFLRNGREAVCLSLSGGASELATSDRNVPP
jgi:outer membrane protein assembly factor BamB